VGCDGRPCGQTLSCDPELTDLSGTDNMYGDGFIWEGSPSGTFGMPSDVMLGLLEDTDCTNAPPTSAKFAVNEPRLGLGLRSGVFSLVGILRLDKSKLDISDCKSSTVDTLLSRRVVFGLSDSVPSSSGNGASGNDAISPEDL